MEKQQSSDFYATLCEIAYSSKQDGGLPFIPYRLRLGRFAPIDYSRSETWAGAGSDNLRYDIGESSPHPYGFVSRSSTQLQFLSRGNPDLTLPVHSPGVEQSPRKAVLSRKGVDVSDLFSKRKLHRNSRAKSAFVLEDNSSMAAKKGKNRPMTSFKKQVTFTIPSNVENDRLNHDPDKLAWVEALGTWVPQTDNPVPYTNFVNSAAMSMRDVSASHTKDHCGDPHSHSSLTRQQCTRHLVHMLTLDGNKQGIQELLRKKNEELELERARKAEKLAALMAQRRQEQSLAQQAAQHNKSTQDDKAAGENAFPSKVEKRERKGNLLPRRNPTNQIVPNASMSSFAANTPPMVGVAKGPAVLSSKTYSNKETISTPILTHEDIILDEPETREVSPPPLPSTPPPVKAQLSTVDIPAEPAPRYTTLPIRGSVTATEEKKPTPQPLSVPVQEPTTELSPKPSKQKPRDVAVFFKVPKEKKDVDHIHESLKGKGKCKGRRSKPVESTCERGSDNDLEDDTTPNIEQEIVQEKNDSLKADEEPDFAVGPNPGRKSRERPERRRLGLNNDDQVEEAVKGPPLPKGRTVDDWIYGREEDTQDVPIIIDKPVTARKITTPPCGWRVGCSIPGCQCAELRRQAALFPDVPDLPTTGATPTSASFGRRRDTQTLILVPPVTPKENALRRPPKLDRSFLDEMERQRLAEERLAKALKLLERLQSNDLMSATNEHEIEEIPSLDEYDWLSRYSILNKGMKDIYERTFETVDEDKRGWLSPLQTLIALKAVNRELSDVQEEYVFRILKLVGYDLSQGTDARLFGIIAALSHKIALVDDWLKDLISSMNFQALELRMYMCKTLWECNVDPETNTVSIDQLCVELRAGGVSLKHELEVRNKLSHLDHLDLLDFLTYIPLFVMIHLSVVDNPLDTSRQK